jgi:hypothetical protein
MHREEIGNTILNTKDELRLQMDMVSTAINDRPDLAYVHRLVGPLASKDDMNRTSSSLS